MDQKDSPTPNAKVEQIEAPATQAKRKADSGGSQNLGKQLKRVCGKERCPRAPRPSANGFGMPKFKTSRSAAAELLSLEPALFPTYTAFIYKYYETFCDAPGKARVDERMAIRWLADLLPHMYNHVSLDRTLNEVVTELLQLDMVHQQPANTSGARMVLSQQEHYPATFHGQHQWQWQHQTYQPQVYWQFPLPAFQPPPYWQLSSQSAFQLYPDGLVHQPYSAPKPFGPPGHLPLWPPPQYW